MVVRDLVQRGSVTDRVCARAHSLRSEERTRSSGGVGQKKRKKDAKGEGEPGEKEKREARRVDTAVRSCVCFVSFYRFSSLSVVDEDSGKFQLISDFSDTCFSCFFLFCFFFVRERFYHVGIIVRRRRKHTRIVNNLTRHLIKENNHV